MKRLILSAILCLSVVWIANAQAIQVTTSCGTAYSVTCSGCSMHDLMIVVSTLEARDCGN